MTAEDSTDMFWRRERLLYAAGFFDGEGCIAVSRSFRGKTVAYYTLCVTAYQNVRAPLELLLELFGGSIRQRKEGGWIWLVSGSRARHMLLEIAPHLLVKRTQAEIAAAFQARKGKPGSRYASADGRARDERDWELLRDLKKVAA